MAIQEKASNCRQSVDLKWKLRKALEEQVSEKDDGSGIEFGKDVTVDGKFHVNEFSDIIDKEGKSISSGGGGSLYLHNMMMGLPNGAKYPYFRFGVITRDQTPITDRHFLASFPFYSVYAYGSDDDDGSVAYCIYKTDITGTNFDLNVQYMQITYDGSKISINHTEKTLDAALPIRSDDVVEIK